MRIENVHFQAFSGGRDDQTTAWNCFIEFSWEVADEPSVKSGERMEVSVKAHNMGTRTRRNSRRLTSFTRMAGLRLREKKKQRDSSTMRYRKRWKESAERELG